MNILAKIVHILGWTWIAVAGFVIIAGYVMILFKEGLGALWETLSPHNISNFVAIVLTLAPGLVLLQLAKAIQLKLRGKCVAALVALPVTVGIVIIMFNIANRSDVKDDNWADAINVKDRPWRADECSDYLITSVCSGMKEFDDHGKLPAVIRVGDVITYTTKEGKESAFTVRNIAVYTYSEDLDTNYGGKRLTAKKGDTTCTIYNERSRSKIVNKEGAWLSKIVVKNCQKLASPEKTTFPTTDELRTVLHKYETVVGVFPKEFLQFSPVQQEAYVRGVLDGEYFLLETSKHPDRDGFVSCLNARLKTILSEVKSFVGREGEQNFLTPWTLSRLVGERCPKKETNAPGDKPSKYTEASTSTKLVFMGAPGSSDAEFQKEQEVIDKAFIRGVLDGKVFLLYGYGYSKLPVYLECLSKQGSLDKIFVGMRAANAFAYDLDKSQAYNVAQAEAHVCEGLN